MVLTSPKVRERVDGEVRNEYRMGNETYLSADDVAEIHWEDDEYGVSETPPGAPPPGGSQPPPSDADDTTSDADDTTSDADDTTSQSDDTTFDADG